MNQLLERLRKDLQNEDARYAYADSVVNAFISAQIKNLREDRELSQQQLADLIGTKQSGISRLEKADYSAWKVATLRKLARAFGVRLSIGFEEFGTLIDDVAGFKKKRLLPCKFEDDPVFNQSTNTEETQSAVIGTGAEEAQREPTQIPTDTNTYAELLSRQRPRQPVGSKVFLSGGAAQTAIAARLG